MTVHTITDLGPVADDASPALLGRAVTVGGRNAWLGPKQPDETWFEAGYRGAPPPRMDLFDDFDPEAILNQAEHAERFQNLLAEQIRKAREYGPTTPETGSSRRSTRSPFLR